VSNTIDPKVVSRIHKLLALANDGGANEHEAELAMSMAQAEMLKHNLSMATIEASGGKSEGRVKEHTQQNLLYTWKRELLETIAKVNFCHLYITHKRTAAHAKLAGGYEIIGRASNVAAVKNMFDYLLQTVERLVVAEVGVNPQDRFNRYSHSFRLGASERLRERLTERHDRQMEEQARKEREAAARASHPSAATGNALVVVMADFAQQEADLNNDMLNGWEPGTTLKNRLKYEADKLKRQQAFEQRLVKIKADEPGIDDTLARYLASGWMREQALKVLAPEPEKPKTERQQRLEDEKNERYWKRERDKEYNRNRKIDWTAHDRGASQADAVGLDDQIDERQQRRIK